MVTARAVSALVGLVDITLPILRGTGELLALKGRFGGLSIWDANPKIVAHMHDNGTLFATEKVAHSYMHCWRHKTPLILRATSQWFAGMNLKPKEGATLRERALRNVEETTFYPTIEDRKSVV